MIIFISCVLISIIIHELGHLIAGVLCGVKPLAFSIGFGRSFLHKKIFGIDWRLSPILLGGYCKFNGEDSKIPGGLLAQRYTKKFIILIAGVSMNFLLAFITYIINYKSLKIGLYIDFTFIKWIFTGININEGYNIVYLIQSLNLHPNLFLVQLGILNLVLGLTNILPIPVLDGAWLWEFWLEKPLGKYFIPYLKIAHTIGFIVLHILIFGWIISQYI